jgi:hypothetical protein
MADSYSIAGKTFLDGAPAEATVRLYEAETGEFRAETQSDQVTGEYEFLYEEATEATGDEHWSSVTFLVPFDGSTNSIAPTGGRAGTIVGSASLNAAFAKHGSHCLANFANGYVNYGTDPDGFLDFNGDSFTIDVWVFPLSRPSTGSWHCIIQNLSDSPAVGWRLLLGNNGQVNFAGYPDPGAIGGFTSSGTVPLNQWSFLRVTYDGVTTALKCHINGVAAFNSSGLIRFKPAGSNAKVLVGVTADYTSWKFNGYVDSIRITKGAVRTPDEVPAGYYVTGLYAEAQSGIIRAGESYFVLAHYGEGVRPLAHGPIVPAEVA